MNALALAARTAIDGDYTGRLAELVDLAALVERGWDPERRRFVPAPQDPLFGYSRCPVRGCQNVTEHTATALCTRCQHRYGRWSRPPRQVAGCVPRRGDADALGEPRAAVPGLSPTGA